MATSSAAEAILGMTEAERYDFDRLGYIHVPGFLTASETEQLRGAVDRLEAHARAHLPDGAGQHEVAPPIKHGPNGGVYHYDPVLGYHAQGGSAEGQTIIIEDFFNGDSAFDCLVNHERTMKYVHEVVKEGPTINNSEIRCRYRGNASGAHGSGSVVSRKYRYDYRPENGIECGMVRMVYFVRDNDAANGAFCVVPGSHKANLPVPQEYLLHPDTDPSMVALEVKASDAIFFTENLRHGGLTNHTDTPRLTLHVGYGPRFFMSQNIATMDEPQFLTPSTIARYSAEQLALFPKASLLGRDDAKVLLTPAESKALLQAAAAARL